MIGHTTPSFSFDSDRELQSHLRIWITETQTSTLLWIKFCRQYVSKLHFELPAIELEDAANAFCYGNLCATKPYPFVSKLHTIRKPLQYHTDAKTSRVWNYLSEKNLKLSHQKPPLFLMDTHSNQD